MGFSLLKADSDVSEDKQLQLGGVITSSVFWIKTNVKVEMWWSYHGYLHNYFGPHGELKGPQPLSHVLQSLTELKLNYPTSLSSQSPSPPSLPKLPATYFARCTRRLGPRPSFRRQSLRAAGWWCIQTHRWVVLMSSLWGTPLRVDSRRHITLQSGFISLTMAKKILLCKNMRQVFLKLAIILWNSVCKRQIRYICVGHSLWLGLVL